MDSEESCQQLDDSALPVSSCNRTQPNPYHIAFNNQYDLANRKKANSMMSCMDQST